MTNSYNWSHRKLTFEQAEEVRRIYASTKTTHKALAQQFNIGITTIRFIINNQRYKHPAPSPQKVRK